MAIPLCGTNDRLQASHDTTSATAPRKKTVSPGTRSQRRSCITGVYMNSGLRAYQ